jgi:hypothetical protein
MEIGLNESTHDTLSSAPSSSRKRPQDPDSALLESLQKRVSESGIILKNLSKDQQQPITARTTFVNYVKDSLLTMSKAKYKQARSTINRLLSDLMEENSDDDIPSAMELPIPAIHQASHSQPPHPLRPSSAPSFSSFGSSASEQYQPPPHMWKNVPPASSVWGSQSTEYMEQYHQQPFQHLHQQMPPPPPLHQIMPHHQQPRQQTQQQQQQQQRTTTSTPVSAALGAAAQVLLDQPSPTQPSPDTAFGNSLGNNSTLSNFSGFSAIMGSPPGLGSEDGELNTPPQPGKK